jgi:hypothetical protein
MAGMNAIAVAVKAHPASLQTVRMELSLAEALSDAATAEEREMDNGELIAKWYGRCGAVRIE